MTLLMEIPMLRKVECILIVTCCLIVAPAITTPEENSEVNSENTVQVPRFHYLSEDSPKEDTWNYDYPRFPLPVQEISQETKRRSSFFPVRGKKIVPNAHLFDGKSMSEGFYDSSHNRQGDDQGDQRSQLLPQHTLGNVAEPLDFLDFPKWATAQKRPSSFMPMRGRKRHVDVDNMKVLEQYLSSKARDGILDPTYEDIFHRPINDGMRKVDRDQNDRTNYPNFYDKSTKEEVNFLDRNQIEKHFKFIPGDPSVEEIENEGAGIVSNPVFLPGGNVPAKRALSFVPTRGRRANPGKFESDPTMPHATVELSDSFSTKQRASSLSRYPYQVEGKSHQRYRRASAFMPMRGRKSIPSPYGLPAYNYLLVDHVPNLDNIGRPNSLDGTMQDSLEINDTDGERQKRNSDGARVRSPFTRQNLRTALVMKRPLSFFAARGKRLNA